MDIQFLEEKGRAEGSRASQDRNSPARRQYAPSIKRLKQNYTNIQAICGIYEIEPKDIELIEKVCRSKLAKIEEDDFWKEWQKRFEEREAKFAKLIANPNWEKELDEEIEEIQNKKKRSKEKEGYMYAITLTLKAENCKENEREHWKDILSESAHKIVTGKNIIEQDWQLELTKQGIPHVHIYVKSKKYIRKQELVKKYPHGYIYCKKVINKEAYLNYVAKERNTSEA